MGAPRWAQKPDENQGEIVQALENIGCSVYDASRVGGSFPDLVVGIRGLTILLEVKTERGRVRKEQTKWHENWRGCTFIVRSPMEAIDVVMAHVRTHTIR